MKLNPVLLEIMRHKVTAAAEEMAITLTRTATTVYIKEAADFCTALADTNGKFFAYPEAIGVSGFINLDCMPTILAAGALEDGDVILTNDPFGSGALASHLPDLQLVKPYFIGGRVVAYGWCFAHTADIGGAVPSSISPRFSEIFQEGLRIPPMKIVKRGVANEEFLNLYRANCRTPESNMGDLKAMLASLDTGERRIGEIAEIHGADVLMQAQAELASYAAEKARAVLRKIPDGKYAFWDYLDDDFVTKLPVRIRCELTVKDGGVHADFAGTDPQLGAAYNVPTNDGKHPWLMLRLMHLVTTTDKSAPLNHGLYASLTASAPKGSMLNPEFPAAVGVRHASVIRIVDTVAGALLRADPTLVPVASGGAVIPAVLSEYDDITGTRGSTVMQALICGSGARVGADGTDGRECGMSNMQNSPTERTEDDAGVMVEEYALRPDSGGAGRWRGGTGLVYTVRILREGSAVLGRGLERFVFRPWGIAGGMPGSHARVVLNIGQPGERELGKLDVLEVKRNDTVTIMTPGGGGYGNPLDRPAEAVVADVRLGFITATAAERDYGLVIVDGAVNEVATAAARKRLAATPRPDFDFGPERLLWEAVFSDDLVTALNNALLSEPVAARIRLRRDIYFAVAPKLADPALVSPLSALDDPAAQRAHFARLVGDLQTRRAA